LNLLYQEILKRLSTGQAMPNIAISLDEGQTCKNRPIGRVSPLEFNL
jgi:hypothetical protein